VLYGNEEYMGFLSSFFTATAASYAESERFLNLVNDVEQFDSLMAYFGRNKLLHNDTLRELAVMKFLFDKSTNPELKKNRIVNIMNQASTRCKSSENRKIAANLSKKIGKLLAGYPAPAFALQDKNGTTVKLESLKGKYVYIAFWKANCTVCEEEMRMIPELKKKYGNKVAFVYISLDQDPSVMKDFLKKYPKFDWYFLSYTDQKTIMDDYNVLAIPYYILIHPTGNISQAPAPHPGLDLDKLLNDLIKKK